MLHHVALETDPADADAAVAFWGLLGFEEVDPPGSLRERARWLEREGTQVHILFREGAEAPPEGHAAIVVADFERTFAAVEAAGHEIERRREHWGEARALTIAPGGHRVEIMSAAPG